MMRAAETTLTYTVPVINAALKTVIQNVSAYKSQRCSCYTQIIVTKLQLPLERGHGRRKEAFYGTQGISD